MEEDSNKVMTSEMVVGNTFALGIDGACAVLETISAGVGAAVTPVVQSAAVFVIDWWLGSKGGAPPRFGEQIIKYGAGLLPLLPTTTAIFNTKVILHNKITTQTTSTETE